MEKIILAIETSCDETAISILKGHKTILSNIVSSQIENHQEYGGVIPELASRLHLNNIDIVLEQALKQAKITLKDIDLIAVVDGPGLVGALHVGLMFAKSLSFINNIPLLNVHHIAGHIYANTLIKDFEFPLLALVVSGGHTQLVLMKKHLDFEIIGQTRDDAIGESYDKIARIIGLPYPGGPNIEKLARDGNDLYEFPQALLDEGYDFSYSGLKSAVLNKVNHLKMKQEDYNNADIACSFQKAAIAPLVSKTVKAIKEFNVKQFVLAGGVAANNYLREELVKVINQENLNVDIIFPPLWACSDNSIMSAALASYYDESNYHYNYQIKANPNKKIILNSEVLYETK